MYFQQMPLVHLMNYTIFLQSKGEGLTFSGPEDPKIHDQVLSYQTRVLAHILHPNTLQRIIDSELYGNRYNLSRFYDGFKRCNV